MLTAILIESYATARTLILSSGCLWSGLGFLSFSAAKSTTTTSTFIGIAMSRWHWRIKYWKKKKRKIPLLIVNNINKILENSTLCVRSYCLFQAPSWTPPDFNLNISSAVIGEFTDDLLFCMISAWLGRREEEPHIKVPGYLSKSNANMFIVPLKTWMKTAKSPGKSPAMVKWNPAKRDLFPIKPGSSDKLPSFRSFTLQPRTTES